MGIDEISELLPGTAEEAATLFLGISDLLEALRMQAHNYRQWKVDGHEELCWCKFWFSTNLACIGQPRCKAARAAISKVMRTRE